MSDFSPAPNRNPHHSPLSADELLGHLFEHLQKGIPFPLNITGISMIPFLHPKRDSVLLVSPDRRKVHRGEILLCRRPNGTLVLHRCVKVYKDGGVLLNGDSQQWRERLPAASVLALADSIRRDGKLIACDRFAYRLLASLWLSCRPIRPFLFRTVAFFRKCFKRG